MFLSWDLAILITWRMEEEDRKDKKNFVGRCEATPFLMWKALKDFFQRIIDQRKLELKDKLRKIKMEKGDSIPKYLTKFVHCKDELGSVGVTIYE